MRSFPKNVTADAQYALNKFESLGSVKQLILHGNRQLHRLFRRIWQFFFDVVLLPNMQFECCMIHQGTLDGTFDIFAASGECTTWVLLWKTRSRPIGVRVRPAAQFSFSSTAFDPRARVDNGSVLERNFGRQPQLITPENERGDTTNYSSPPTYTFFDGPEVPIGPQGPRPPAPPEPHEPPGPPGPPGLPPGWPPAHHQQVVEKESEQEIHCVSDCILDLHRPSINLFQYQ